MAMLFPDAPADVPEGFAYHADVMTEVEERALLDIRLRDLARRARAADPGVPARRAVTGSTARRRRCRHDGGSARHALPARRRHRLASRRAGLRRRRRRLAARRVPVSFPAGPRRGPTDARGDAGAALGLRARRRRALAVAARDPSGARGALLGHLQDAPGWRR